MMPAVQNPVKETGALGLLIGAVALALAVAVWIMPAPSGSTNARAQAAPQPVVAEAPLDLEVVTARPLFDRTRQPLVIEQAPAPAVPAPAAIIIPSLHGVIGNSDGGLAALMRMSTSDELITREVGESLGGFKVESVDNKRTILSDGDGNLYTLLLGTE